MLCVLNVASFNVLTIKENRPLYFIGGRKEWKFTAQKTAAC